MDNNKLTAEVLYYLAGAFKSGIDGGFVAREHASSIFKKCLREAGYELPKKDSKQKEGGE